MFTGIVEEIGRIKQIIAKGQALSITIACHRILTDVSIGDSIAVNGICLTVTAYQTNAFEADVMPETFRSTSFSELRAGSLVNLERALPLGGRLGGHLVSGHIDGTGILIKKKQEENAIWLDITPPEDLMKYIVLKGSVALDGTSLTVSSVEGNQFSVSLIPHTAETTILANKQSGDRINIECDLLAKYVENLLISNRTEAREKGNLSVEKLMEMGY